ncbi:hypothetical protein BDR04DRAFT_584371 [Suillus decipiens]|nr:hypothetical protein BDR04DRAFT_584371 [Suillus decipiens]
MIHLHKSHFNRLNLQLITYLFICLEYQPSMFMSLAPKSSFTSACGGMRPPLHRTLLARYLRCTPPSLALLAIVWPPFFSVNACLPSAKLILYYPTDDAGHHH